MEQKVLVLGGYSIGGGGGNFVEGVSNSLHVIIGLFYFCLFIEPSN